MLKVLKGGRLIDGTGAGPAAGITIVIRDGRIDAVTTRAADQWPDDAEVIDVAGMTVLPGLIDCHDHLAMHGYDLARRWGIDEPQSTRTLRTAKVLEQTLTAGYTTIRDAAGLDAGFKRAVEEGLIAGPRLVISSTSSRRSAASGIASAHPGFPAVCRKTRCCPMGSSTAWPMCAPSFAAWCGLAPT